MIGDPEGHIIAKSQIEEDDAVTGEIELDECARVRKGNIQTGATSELIGEKHQTSTRTPISFE